MPAGSTRKHSAPIIHCPALSAFWSLHHFAGSSVRAGLARLPGSPGGPYGLREFLAPLAVPQEIPKSQDLFSCHGQSLTVAASVTAMRKATGYLS